METNLTLPPDNRNETKDPQSKEYYGGGTNEEKEDKIEDFETRRKTIEEEKLGIADRFSVDIAVNELYIEGFQIIINEYGVDVVFEAINKIRDQKKNPGYFNIIKELEPNPKKRAELFDTIEKKSQQEGEKIDRILKEGSDREKKYIDRWILNGEAMINRTKTNMVNLRQYDSIFTKIERVLGRGPSLRMENYIQTLINESTEIKNQLIRAGGNMMELGQERDEERRRQREELDTKINNFNIEVEREIQKITNELNKQLTDWKIKMLSDVASIDSLTEVSENNRLRLEEVLKKIELEITEREEQVQKEILQKIKPLQNLIIHI